MRKKPSPQLSIQRIFILAFILVLLPGCSAINIITEIVTPAPLLTSPTNNTSTGENPTNGLSEEEIATLSSLEKIDDYPLYTMHYIGGYDQRRASFRINGDLVLELPKPRFGEYSSTWACSLFATHGDPEYMLFGRNFDWEHSPAILLFTDPPDGYASVSMVDMAYLGFSGTEADLLTDLSLNELEGLLDAPFLPFDGMNEQGLAVGMAAVPPGNMLDDPSKETIDSVMVIRLMLDHASTVDEAIAILESYNIDMTGGPPIHYLLADSSGNSVLAEFYQGELVIIPNEIPWHLATNFLRASYNDSVKGVSWRYDILSWRLSKSEGQLSLQEAMGLLEDVSQTNTQWSVVYGMSTGEIIVSMERQYDNVYAFTLSQPNQ